MTKVSLQGISRLVVYAAMCVALVAPRAVGQAASQPQSKTTKSALKTVTLSGCVVKGDEPNEFNLLAEDGKRYGLEGKSVPFAKHLGHKVTITGGFKPEKPDEKEKNEPGGGEVGDIRVTSLKMLNDSCK